MKLKLYAAMAVLGMFCAQNVIAQEDANKPERGKKKKTLTISNQGIHVESNDGGDSVTAKAGKLDTKNKKDKEKVGKLDLTYAMMDLGLNTFADNTNYADPSVVNYLNVPAANRNEQLFDLRNGKSINVNIYPLMVKMPIVKTRTQRLYISTGAGLQIYNYRYERPLTYTKDPNVIILDTISFKKNKLAINYVNIPLMLTAKTRLHKDTWLVYGAGVTAGYRLSSWNKQVSDERGKVKTRGNFDLADFNTCLTAEFGVEGIIRFYGSYQLTSIYDNGIDHRPISFGIKIGGI